MKQPGSQRGFLNTQSARIPGSSIAEFLRSQNHLFQQFRNLLHCRMPSARIEYDVSQQRWHHHGREAAELSAEGDAEVAAHVLSPDDSQPTGEHTVRAIRLDGLTTQTAASCSSVNSRHLVPPLCAPCAPSGPAGRSFSSLVALLNKG